MRKLNAGKSEINRIVVNKIATAKLKEDRRKIKATTLKVNHICDNKRTSLYG